jgi:hypothetical protein
MTTTNSTTSTATSQLPSQPHEGSREPGAKRDNDENIEISAKEGKDKKDARRIAQLEHGWLCGHSPTHCTEGKDDMKEPPTCSGTPKGKPCSHKRCEECLPVRIFLESHMDLRDKIRPDPKKGLFGWFHDDCRTHHAGLSPESKVCKECKKDVKDAYAYTFQPVSENGN